MSVLYKFVQHFERFSPRKACLKKWGDGQRFNIHLIPNGLRVEKKNIELLLWDSWVCRPSRLRLLILFFICFLFPGYALKCYQCVSVKSWDDCKNSTKEVTCLGSQDRCAKVYVKAKISGVTKEAFGKGCATSSDCSATNCKKIVPSGKIIECEIECCTGDLCNGAEVPMVSAIMLLACAIIVFAR